MTPLCASCRAPLGDDAVICVRCMGGLERDLGDVAAVSEELDTTLSRISRMTPGTIGYQEPPDAWTLDRPELGVEAQPTPYHGGASLAAGNLRAVLVGWVRDIAGDDWPMDTPGWPADTLAAMSRWLLRRDEAIRHHPAAAEIVSEVHDAMLAARRAVDLSPHRSRVHVGPCPETVDGLACAGQVQATFPLDPGQVATMCCAVCGATWEPAQWREAGRRIMRRNDERRAG